MNYITHLISRQNALVIDLAELRSVSLWVADDKRKKEDGIAVKLKADATTSGGLITHSHVKAVVRSSQVYSSFAY